MVSWRLLPEDHPPQAWDEALSRFPDHSIFQSSAWAEYKRALGWTPLRLKAHNGGELKALMQILARRLPMGTLLWSRGGAVGDPQVWDEGLRRALLESLSGWAYLRLCSYRPEEDRASGAMGSRGWGRPPQALSRRGTFVLDLAQEEPALRAGLSANWAHNLRRAEKRCRPPRLWERPKAAELARVYRSMETHKGLRQQHGERDLEAMIKHLPSLLLYRAEDASGPIALRACAIFADKAWDLLAAASAQGRKCYASYALLWALVQECRRRGVKAYDLGGADPEKASGVYDFKKGTGARPFQYLGEWDWAKPRCLRGPAGALIGFWSAGAL